MIKGETDKQKSENSGNVEGARSISTRETVRFASKNFETSEARVNHLAIINDEGFVCGLLSDLEIRLGLIAGHTIDDPVTKFMKPIRPSIAWEDLPHNSEFNSERKKIGYRQANLNNSSEEVHALIMAGGFGRRLGVMTETTPKPLLKIGNKRIVEHVFDQLNQIKFDKIYLAVHHLWQQFIDFVSELGLAEQVELILEERPLGTAGAISLIPNLINGHLLVINADILSNLDLSKMLQFHRHFENDMTLAVFPHETKIPYGVTEFDSSGKFLHVSEKPTFLNYVLAGVYILSPKALALVECIEEINMPDLIESAKQQGLNVRVFPLFEQWLDVGDVNSFAKAKELYSD